MEIVVKGEAEKTFKPNLIKIDFNFKVKSNTYDLALERGVYSVENYIKLLEKLGFNKENVKTRNLRISEDSVYDENTKKYIKVGYVFNQSLNLEFDYNVEKMSLIMEETSVLENAPTYYINFSIKEDKKAKEELLDLAFEDAKFQANAISKASNKKLIDCVKTSFEPFDNNLVSRTSYGLAKMSRSDESYDRSVQDTIKNIFVPEDIVANMEIYTIWIAE